MSYSLPPLPLAWTLGTNLNLYPCPFLRALYIENQIELNVPIFKICHMQIFCSVAVATKNSRTFLLGRLFIVQG